MSAPMTPAHLTDAEIAAPGGPWWYWRVTVALIPFSWAQRPEWSWRAGAPCIPARNPCSANANDFLDARFITAGRQDIPDLLAEVARLRAQVFRDGDT